jgi:hypothetical protein
VPRGFFETALIGSFQAEEPRQGGRVGALQPQTGIGGKMPLGFAGVVVVVALQAHHAEDPLHLQRGAPLADLPGLGQIGGVEAIDRFLQQAFQQRVGGLEQGRAQEHFEPLHRAAVQGLGGKPAQDGLDFGFLREVEVGRERSFFLTPASRSSRLRVLSTWTYLSRSSWN